MAPLAPEAVAAVEAAFEATRDAETRLRYQMVLLAQQGKTAPEVGRLTRRPARTVVRVVRRYQTGGVAAVPYRWSAGGPPTVTDGWRAELLRVVELSPR